MKAWSVLLFLIPILLGGAACDTGDPLEIVDQPGKDVVTDDGEVIGGSDAGHIETAGDSTVAEDQQATDSTVEAGPPCTTADDCEDNDPCTKDVCLEGGCANQSILGCESCKEDDDCSDGDGCTQDECNDQICLHVPIGGEDCVDCEGTGECDDGNECTYDHCLDEGYCEFTCQCDISCIADEDCVTGNPCVPALCELTMGSGYCTATECVDHPKDCDDGDECTKDSCDPETGECLHEEATGCGSCDNDNDCDDEDPCTTDECAGDPGKCIHGKMNCDDGDDCTTDFCLSSTGCQHLDICFHCETDEQCEDENLCTVDWCDLEADGTCINEAIDCNDNCLCTMDLCDPDIGCVHPVDPDCELCEFDEDCDDGDPCTVDECDLLSVCDDGCTYNPVVCDDGNPCTEDFCDPVDGCASLPYEGPCDDGSLCTTGDSCEGGECTGTPVSCDDANGCTSDYCADDIGCYYTFNTDIDCEDGNACTVGDKCNASGNCISGPAPNCDDNVKCTIDTCDPGKGCVWTLDTENCNCDNNDAKCDDHDPSTSTCCKWVKWWQVWDAWRCVVNDC